MSVKLRPWLKSRCPKCGAPSTPAIGLLLKCTRCPWDESA